VKQLVLLLALVALTACGEKEKEAPPQYTVEQHSIVVFPAGSPQIGSITSVPIEPRREMTLRFNGRLVWNEDRTVRVFPPFAGRVIEIAVRPGDRIKVGQTLAVLASPDLGQAQSDARKAEQDFALAQKNLARVEELFMAGVAPAKDRQAAQADVARSRAEKERTLAKLRLYGKTDTVDQTLALRSPIGGVVVERNLNPGQELRPDNQGDKALFVISDPTQLWFLLDVAEKDIPLVKEGTEISITTTSLGTDRVKGKIRHVADVVDPQTRSVKVRGTVEASDERLKAEMYIVAELSVPAPGGFLVPARAVYLRGEQQYVFIDEGNGRYARRAIRPGPLTDGYQVVLQGLAATDKVVLDGSLLLERLLASKD
jgi:cobalt-zinc-cadmium efflux system membrane fusion protein